MTSQTKWVQEFPGGPLVMGPKGFDLCECRCERRIHVRGRGGCCGSTARGNPCRCDRYRRQR